jgi:hypothetical protein
MVMASQKSIQGILNNFLGTYTSRYSDFGGYWVFGFLVDGICELNVDLLKTSIESNSAAPKDFAIHLAAQRFSEQIFKNGLPKSWFREAHLIISKSPEAIRGFVNGRSSSGYALKFHTHVLTDLGKAFCSEASVFVAPHNPKIELRSTRTT